MHRAILCVVATGLASLPSAAARADEPPPAATLPPATTPPPAITPPPAAAVPLAPRPAPLPPRVLEPVDPLNDIGGAALIGGGFSLVVLLACVAANIPTDSKAKCTVASGLSALGLLGIGIPMIAIARQQRFVAAAVPYVDRVTFVVGAHRATVGWTWRF